MTAASVVKARRELNNLRAFVRRTGLTGWVDRNAGYSYQGAFAAVVAVEDELGVEDPTAIKLADRLLELRLEAQAAGLLTPAEILKAERAAL